jgi:hypothetical protein
MSDRVACEPAADFWAGLAPAGRLDPGLAAESLHHATPAAQARPDHPSTWFTPIHASA